MESPAVASDWKNQKKRDAEPSEMVAVRVPSRLKAAVQAKAEAGESTLAAAVRWGLETFLEQNEETAAPDSLFD
jgi:hypothetical protein